MPKGARTQSARWSVEGQRRSIHGPKGLVWSHVGEFYAKSGDDAKARARDVIKTSRDPEIAGGGWTLKFRARKRARQGFADENYRK